MPSLTTKYDKIGDERKKVFVLRGDEAYARTVDVSLTHTFKNTNDTIQGYLVRFDATLYRNLGDSILLLYDGDSLLAQVDTHDYKQNYTFDNIRLGWGEEHKLYVRYKANKQTLGKKSKSLTISKNIPSQYVPTINLTGNTQVTETSNYTVNGTATFMNDTVANGTELNIYLDGELKGTVSTESGAFSCNVGELVTGKHTVTAETIQSVSMNASSQDKTLNVGYDVQIIQYPSKLIEGYSQNKFKIAVKTWSGASVGTGNVRFNGVNRAVTNQGICEFNLSTIATGDYYATYGSSKSKTIHIISYDPTMEITSTQKYVAEGYAMPIEVYLANGSGITLGVYNNVGNVHITDLKVIDNVAQFWYRANGAGERSIDFNNGNSIVNYSFIDTIMHRAEGRTYNLVNRGFDGGKYEETTTGCKVILPNNTSKITFTPSPRLEGENNINVIEFKVKKFQPSTLQDTSGNIVLSFNNNSTVLNLPPSALKQGKTIKVRVHDDIMTDYVQVGSNVVENNISLDSSVSKVSSWSLTNEMVQNDTSVELELEYLIFYHK